MALKHTHMYLGRGTKATATLSDPTSRLLRSPHG